MEPLALVHRRSSFGGPVRIQRRIARITSLLLAVLPLGCKEDYWFGDGNETRAKVESPTGVQAGDVSLSYTLTGNQPSARVSVSYSADGLVFHDATRGSGGEGTTDLAVSSAGVQHTFSWNSALDLDRARSSAVILKIAPADGISGRTDSMVVHNVRFLAALTGTESSSGRRRLLFAEVGAVRGELEIKEEDVLPNGHDLSDVIHEGGHFFVCHTDSATVSVLKIDEESRALTLLPEIPPPVSDTGDKLLAASDSRLFILNRTAGTLRAVEINTASEPLTLQYGPSVSLPGGKVLAARPGKVGVVCESAGLNVIHLFDISGGNNLLEDKELTVNDLEAPTAIALQDEWVYVAAARPDSIWIFKDEGDDLIFEDTRMSSTATPGIGDLSIDSGRLIAVEGSQRILSIPLGSDGRLLTGQETSFANSSRAYSMARGAGKVVVVASPTAGGVEFGTWAANQSGGYDEFLTLSITSASSIRIAISD